jgi:hypothetical protein
MELRVILGMVGRAGSGKDTIADLLVYHHGFVKVALADPLKRICRNVYGFTDDQLWGPSSTRNAPDMRYPRPDPPTHWAPCPEYLTPRYALQRLGTEWGRACYENTWIDLALRTARVLLYHCPIAMTYTPKYGLQPTDLLESAARKRHIRGIVLSDVRFPNEAHAIRAAGGRLWRTTHGEGLGGVAGTHESERYVDALEVDGVVPDSPVEALPEIVATMLKEVLR